MYHVLRKYHFSFPINQGIKRMSAGQKNGWDCSNYSQGSFKILNLAWNFTWKFHETSRENFNETSRESFTWNFPTISSRAKNTGFSCFSRPKNTARHDTQNQSFPFFQFLLNCKAVSFSHASKFDMKFLIWAFLTIFLK